MLLSGVQAGVESFDAIGIVDTRFLFCMTLYLGKWQFLNMNCEVLSLAPVYLVMVN